MQNSSLIVILIYKDTVFIVQVLLLCLFIFSDASLFLFNGILSFILGTHTYSENVSTMYSSDSVS